MKRLVLALALFPALALAQSQVRTPDGSSVSLMTPACINASGLAIACGTSNPLAMMPMPVRGMPARINLALGAATVEILPAGSNRTFWLLQNRSTTATLTCTIDGTEPSASNGFNVFPMGYRTQDGAGGRYMMTGALRCQSSAAGTQIYAEYAQ